MNPAPPVTKILMRADILPDSYVYIPAWALPAQVNQHSHGVEPHHILLRTLDFDCALHIVRGRVCVTPKNIGQVFTAAPDNEISHSLRIVAHRHLSILDRHRKVGANIACLEINDAVPVAQGAQHTLAFACLRDIVIESLSEFLSCRHRSSLLFY